MIVKNKYVTRNTHITPRNWWLVKYDAHGCGGRIELGCLCLPMQYVGKRIRLKVEVIEDE